MGKIRRCADRAISMIVLRWFDRMETISRMNCAIRRWQRLIEHSVRKVFRCVRVLAEIVAAGQRIAYGKQRSMYEMMDIKRD